MSDHIEHPCASCGSLLTTRFGYCAPCWKANKCDFCGSKPGDRTWRSSGDTWICGDCEEEN